MQCSKLAARSSGSQAEEDLIIIVIIIASIIIVIIIVIASEVPGPPVPAHQWTAFNYRSFNKASHGTGQRRRHL